MNETLCSGCESRPTEDGKRTCRKCREKARYYRHRLAQEYRQAGCCTQCGRPWNGSTHRCSECLSQEADNYHKRRNEENRQLYAEPCCVCGAGRPETRTLWHHINPLTKTGTVGDNRGVQKKSEEVKKCVPLCTSCHNQVHWGLRQTGRLSSRHARAFRGYLSTRVGATTSPQTPPSASDSSGRRDGLSVSEPVPKESGPGCRAA